MDETCSFFVKLCIIHCTTLSPDMRHLQTQTITKELNTVCGKCIILSIVYSDYESPSVSLTNVIKMCLKNDLKLFYLFSLILFFLFNEFGERHFPLSMCNWVEVFLNFWWSLVSVLVRFQLVGIWLSPLRIRFTLQQFFFLPSMHTLIKYHIYAGFVTHFLWIPGICALTSNIHKCTPQISSLFKVKD